MRRSQRLARVVRVREIRERLATVAFARADHALQEARTLRDTVEGYVLEAARRAGRGGLHESYGVLIAMHASRADEDARVCATAAASAREVLRAAFRRRDGVTRLREQALAGERLLADRAARVELGEIALRRWSASSMGGEGCGVPLRSPIVAPSSPSPPDHRVPTRRTLPSEDGTSWPS